MNPQGCYPLGKMPFLQPRVFQKEMAVLVVVVVVVQQVYSVNCVLMHNLYVEPKRDTGQLRSRPEFRIYTKLD